MMEDGFHRLPSSFRFMFRSWNFEADLVSQIAYLLALIASLSLLNAAYFSHAL